MPIYTPYDAKNLTSFSDTNRLQFEATRTTPYVFFDSQIALLELRGRSSPHDSRAFYDNILHELDKVGKNGAKAMNANFSLEYFNTSSAKCMFDIFKKLQQLEEKIEDVVINWYYDEGDDDMYEIGEDYGQMVNLKFNLIPIQ